MSAYCQWCHQEFERHRDGGSRQKFCSVECRTALRRAARRWALAELAASRVTLAEFKKASPTYTLIASRSEPSPIPRARKIAAVAGADAALTFPGKQSTESDARES